MDIYSDRSLVSIIFRNGQIFGLSPIRGLVSIIFQGLTDTWSFSYSWPRLHYFSGIDRYSDFLLFGAPSPLFFRNGQIPGLEPRLHYFSGMDRYSDFSYSGPRLHFFSGMDRYSDFLLFGISSSLFFRNGQIPGQEPRLHYFSGMDRYSDFLLFGAPSPLFFRDEQILGQEPRLHYFSVMDRYSDFLLFGAPSPLFFRNGQIPGLSPIRGLVSIICQEWIDTRAFPYM